MNLDTFQRNLDEMPYSRKCLLDEMSFRRNGFRRNVMDPWCTNILDIHGDFNELLGCYYICAHFAKISFAPIIHLRA